MDKQRKSLEGGDNLIYEFSEIFELFDSADISEDLPLPESTGLSPLTLSLDHNLTLQEDNLLVSETDMGIENTWTEANSSASDYAIPLPAPPGLDDFTDVGANPMEEVCISMEHGPFLPPVTPILNNLFADTGETQDDSVIVSTPAGVCGLRNLGNTCFMAAGLQCLTATPPVLRHFLELQQRGQKLLHPPPDTLMAHFSSLLGKMWSGRYSVVRPTEFKQTLGAYHSQFKDYRQHDCQEFLALLLDSLHEQTNTAAKICQMPVGTTAAAAATATATAAAAAAAAVAVATAATVAATAATTTTANTTSQNENVGKRSFIEPIITAISNSNCNIELMEMYENSPWPECPNSPNLTMAGSPRDLDSPMAELDSTANSPQRLPLNDNDDEETLDSEEVVDTSKTTFIHNITQTNKSSRDEENEKDGDEKIDENEERDDEDDNDDDDDEEREQDQNDYMRDKEQLTVHATNRINTTSCQPLRFDKLIALSKNVAAQYHGLYDILKDAKTSNANFLVTPQECNNEIHYDSQKFPKDNIRRMTLENSNLMENHDFDNKSVSIKRIKEVNVQKMNCAMDSLSSGGSYVKYDSGLEKCNVKRMRLEDQEKNHKRDGLGTSFGRVGSGGIGSDSDGGGGGGGGSCGGGVTRCSRGLQNNENGAIAPQEELEADMHWAKHLRSNRSIIVDTFQGQFKSTVICEVCKHVSVTYEPFMYLSVPLPHAMERQLIVTYVPANSESPTRCVVSLNKQSRIGKLKEELLKTLGKEHRVAIGNIAMAEVLENHIARILDDNSLLRYVNDTNRTVYAFELSEPPNAFVLKFEDGNAISDIEANNACIATTDNGAVVDREIRTGASVKVGCDVVWDDTGSANGKACQNSAAVLIGEEIGPCTICLEELDGDLKKHAGNTCNFIMCDPCIENYFKNQTEPQMCPVCSTYVTASSFAKIDQTGRPRPAVRILNVPVVLRQDTNETTNNRKGTKLFGYPHLVKLPSRVNAKDLYDIIEKVIPQHGSYTVHFVDGQGHHCSRCMYTAHCTGCRVPETGLVALQNGDTLAIRYTENLPKIVQPIEHITLTRQRPHHPLSLYDCLQAFSQSETLDELNPWFCPTCQRNQCATKTLTVHRYPKFLIVYLKRFVFYECVSMKLDDKVTFPLVGLSVGRHLYDLYACVCHFGGLSAGHYTAYAKNPKTDVWYYYNDEITSRQKPQEEDFSNAYILFYSRQGTSLKPCNI
ncbi:uncharacterized protein LOC107265331 isoform X2 [Cephus cinctus]|uniref:ubiquitinyl hydrolase 1 n=1 Tax=Cephus cinctus TaxID=211228 RepID=A0AAJ7BNX0_CEPCN|nr:uncharacterized protein LOC107265331 isoform X2 [Cephus cinctus]